jgi:hypothetical protein
MSYEEEDTRLNCVLSLSSSFSSFSLSLSLSPCQRDLGLEAMSRNRMVPTAMRVALFLFFLFF